MDRISNLNQCAILLDSALETQQIICSYTDINIDYSPAEQNYIGQLWRLAQTESDGVSSNLFNGHLYHLNAWRFDKGNLLLELSNTNYQQYLATRQSKFIQAFPAAKMADPLAICIALITTDNYLILEQRQNVDVYAGYYHVIGGFMDRTLDHEVPVFAIEREVFEELNLDIFAQVKTLLGLVYDQKIPHPELCFQHRLSINLQEVKLQLADAASVEVVGVEGLANDPIAVSNFIKRNWQQLSVTGLGCLLLHGKKEFGIDWYAMHCSKKLYL